jgi:hypothetical protein
MKTGKSIVDLATELERRANSKRDLVTSIKNLELEATPRADSATPIEFDTVIRVGKDNSFKINSIAHDQIATNLDIPQKYYDRMLKDEPRLLATNCNAWFARNHSKRMVRTLDGTMRAFLSDRYRPIENEDLASAILPILLDSGQFDVMSCDVTDKRLYLKVVDKSVTRELAKTGNYFGDNNHRIVRIAAPAITISNSEVGLGALSIQAGIYDQFCSNLATFSERSMKKYHVGARHDCIGDDVVSFLSAQTQNLTNAALMSQVRDVVVNAFNAERFHALCDKVDLIALDTFEKETDVVELVTLTSRKIGLSEQENKGVLQHLIAGGELSRFGLYNAVTRYSQDVESYDRASELEKLGGVVVELSRNDWQSLLKQASND